MGVYRPAVNWLIGLVVVAGYGIDYSNDCTLKQIWVVAPYGVKKDMSLPFQPLPVAVMPLWPPVGSTSSMEFPASNRSPEMHRFNVPVSSTVRICQHCFCLVLICWLLSCNAQPICFMYDPVDYGTMFLLYCIGNKTHTRLAALCPGLPGFVSSQNTPECRSCSFFDHRNAVPVLFGI